MFENHLSLAVVNIAVSGNFLAGFNFTIKSFNFYISYSKSYTYYSLCSLTNYSLSFF